MSQGAYSSFDPVTGRPVPPAPAAYSAIDPYPADAGAPPAGPSGAYPPGYPTGYEQQPRSGYEPPSVGYQAGYEQPPAGYQAGYQAGYEQPPAGYQAGYQAGYEQPPAGYPGYAAPANHQPANHQPAGYQPVGYQPVGYQLVPMYPMVQQRPPKPGGAVAAAVLGYVQSGFVLVGGITLFSGAAGFEALGTRLGSELTVVAIFAIIAGALLIAGATTMLNRKPNLLTIGSLLSIAISVYFVIRLGDFVGGVTVWVPIVYAVLPILSISLSLTGDVRAWVRARASLTESLAQ